jgi:outer membrane protein TolC
MRRHAALIALAAALEPAIASAQTVPAQREPLQLATLQRDALMADPRVRELQLLDEQTALRLRNIEVERLPAVSALGQAQYQSDVPRPPVTLPATQLLFAAPHETIDASLRVDQRIVDPAAGARLALTRAELAESQSRVHSALFPLRQEVSDTFFSAALLQEQINALAATIADVEARLRETNARVREGAALAADAAAIEATLLQHRQREDELRAGRAAALDRLGRLTHREIANGDTLAVPELADAVAGARQRMETVRARPEYEQFARARDRAARQQDVASAGDRPQVSAFGRVGYGRPGLNFISDQFETYALAGVQLQWKAWTWGSSARERSALALQQSIVDAEEAAFTDSLRRATISDDATIDRLEQALTLDDRIITLRETVDRTTRVRFSEGVVTASEYLDRTTELLGAQLDRARHRVELAQARARLLTTLGLEVQ